MPSCDGFAFSATEGAGAEGAGQTPQEYVKGTINNPIGYGPYVFDEFRESEYVKLSVFADYGSTPVF